MRASPAGAFVADPAGGAVGAGASRGGSCTRAGAGAGGTGSGARDAGGVFEPDGGGVDARTADAGAFDAGADGVMVEAGGTVVAAAAAGRGAISACARDSVRNPST